MGLVIFNQHFESCDRNSVLKRGGNMKKVYHSSIFKNSISSSDTNGHSTAPNNYNGKNELNFDHSRKHNFEKLKKKMNFSWEWFLWRTLPRSYLAVFNNRPIVWNAASEQCKQQIHCEASIQMGKHSYFVQFVCCWCFIGLQFISVLEDIYHASWIFRRRFDSKFKIISNKH